MVPEAMTVANREKEPTPSAASLRTRGAFSLSAWPEQNDPRPEQADKAAESVPPTWPHVFNCPQPEDGSHYVDAPKGGIYERRCG